MSFVERFVKIAWYYQQFQSSNPFEKVSEIEWNELCQQWNRFADVEMEREKKELDARVQQKIRKHYVRVRKVYKIK